MTRKMLKENMNQTRKSLPPQVDVASDLAYKKEFTTNSWFAIGHFETDDRVLDYLFHIMTQD